MKATLRATPACTLRLRFKVLGASRLPRRPLDPGPLLALLMIPSVVLCSAEDWSQTRTHIKKAARTTPSPLSRFFDRLSLGGRLVLGPWTRLFGYPAPCASSTCSSESSRDGRFDRTLLNSYFLNNGHDRSKRKTGSERVEDGKREDGKPRAARALARGGQL